MAHITTLCECLLQSSWWMPPNAAAHGVAVDRLMRWDVGAMAASFLAANILLVWLFLRPRRAFARTILLARRAPSAQPARHPLRRDGRHRGTSLGARAL